MKSSFNTPLVVPLFSAHLRKLALGACLAGSGMFALSSDVSAQPFELAATNPDDLCAAHDVEIRISQQSETSFRLNGEAMWEPLPGTHYLAVNPNTHLTVMVHGMDSLSVSEDGNPLFTESPVDEVEFTISGMATYQLSAESNSVGSGPQSTMTMMVPTTKRVVVKPREECTRWPILLELEAEEMASMSAN